MTRAPLCVAAAGVAAAFFVAAACSGESEPGGQGAGAAPGAAAGEGAADGAGYAPRAPSRGPEHAVYSLVDNRLAAHVQRAGGLVALPGSAGFAKYLRFGKSGPAWDIRRDEGGVRFGAMKSKVAGVVVPLGAEQASGAPVLRLRVRASAPQRLGVRVNGKQDREVTAELTEGGTWSTVELAVPEGTMAAGENEILLFAGKPGLEVAWIQVGGRAPAKDAPAVYDPAQKALLLPDGGGLAWYVMVPEGGRVTGDVAGGGCAVKVRAVPDGGGAPVEGELRGRGAAVDLSPLAGEPVRLELGAAGCPLARISGAALVVPGEAPKAARGPAPKNVILWVMDSLRADRVKIFAGKRARPEVPVFERLAASSAVFTQAYVQGNETKCSHASIWTSLYPVNHQMIPPRSSIDPKWVTVDEVCKKAGLFTSGVSANGYITPSRGFGTGWARFRNHIHEGGGLTAEDLLTRALASIEDPKRPFFLYLGTIDTHVSWRAKEPWFSKYDPEPYRGRFVREASGTDMDKAAVGRLRVSERDVQRIAALYDSNVSYQDQQLGVLLEKLEEWGVADQTMVIVTADHGDELFEDGRVGHGASLKETLVHVPLLIHYPPLFPAGAVVEEGVEVVDIVPTIADALGLAPDPAWQGESLIPLAAGIGRGYPRLSMASKYEDAHVGRMGKWKLYAAGGKAELYDLSAEPAEKTDVSAQHPVALRMLADALWTLRTYNAEWKKSRWGNAANVSAQFAADMGE